LCVILSVFTHFVVDASRWVDTTGEEREDLLAEVKGVKLFIKRGNLQFNGGMTGTLKHLVHKETQEERLCAYLVLLLVVHSSDTVSTYVIVFRREPLWQPTMNARLSAGMRCTYDPNERILRVAAVEPSTNGEGGHELVVYALKVGLFCSQRRRGNLIVWTGQVVGG
jgi:hypothetical protein